MTSFPTCTQSLKHRRTRSHRRTKQSLREYPKSLSCRRTFQSASTSISAADSRPFADIRSAAAPVFLEHHRTLILHQTDPSNNTQELSCSKTFQCAPTSTSAADGSPFTHIRTAAAPNFGASTHPKTAPKQSFKNTQEIPYSRTFHSAPTSTSAADGCPFTSAPFPTCSGVRSIAARKAMTGEAAAPGAAGDTAKGARAGEGEGAKGGRKAGEILGPVIRKKGC
jgi:hypothetical protein